MTLVVIWARRLDLKPLSSQWQICRFDINKSAENLQLKQLLISPYLCVDRGSPSEPTPAQRIVAPRPNSTIEIVFRERIFSSTFASVCEKLKIDKLIHESNPPLQQWLNVWRGSDEDMMRLSFFFAGNSRLGELWSWFCGCIRMFINISIFECTETLLYELSIKTPQYLQWNAAA